MNASAMLQERLHQLLSGPRNDERVFSLHDSDDVHRLIAKYTCPQDPSEPPYDELHVAAGILSPEAALALARFLEASGRSLTFAELTIEAAEDFFDSLQDLAPAFAELASLTRVRLYGAGHHCRVFLRNLDAKLTDVTIELLPVEQDADSDEGDGNTTGTGRNPIILLANFQETLETLTGKRTETLCNEDLTYPQRYPNVEDVCLEEVDLPITLHLVSAFPNLVALTLRASPSEFVGLLDNGAKQLTERRMLNMLEQLRFGCWESLSQLDTTLGTLYVLGLRCHVRELRIACDIEGPANLLASVLMDTRPVALTLHQFYLHMLSSSGFASVLRDPAVRQVRTLEITLILDENSGKGTNIGAAFDAMVDAFRPLEIRALGLALLCNFPRPCARESVLPPSAIPLMPQEVFLRDLNLREFAGRIRATVGSLQSVVVYMLGHRVRKSAAVALGDPERCAELKTFQTAQIYGLAPFRA